jgi:hypothetical protein
MVVDLPRDEECDNEEETVWHGIPVLYVNYAEERNRSFF